MAHWNLSYQTVKPIQFPNKNFNGHDNIKKYVLNTCATFDEQSFHGAKEAHVNSHKYHYETDFISTLCKLAKDDASFNKGY